MADSSFAADKLSCWPAGWIDSSDLDDDVPPPDQAVKMAVIVVATMPIMLVYPFLQKHFAKGALLGSIKG